MRLGYWHSPFYHDNSGRQYHVLQGRGYKWQPQYKDCSTNIPSAIDYKEY